MSDSSSPQAGTPGQDPQQLERFEVVLEPEPTVAAEERTARISELDVDRLPDRERIRLLVDAEQLDRLRAGGMSVRVLRSLPVRPLDPTLITTDEQVAGWLAARIGPAASEHSGDEER